MKAFASHSDDGFGLREMDLPGKLLVGAETRVSAAKTTRKPFAISIRRALWAFSSRKALPCCWCRDWCGHWRGARRWNGIIWVWVWSGTSSTLMWHVLQGRKLPTSICTCTHRKLHLVVCFIQFPHRVSFSLHQTSHVLEACLGHLGISQDFKWCLRQSTNLIEKVIHILGTSTDTVFGPLVVLKPESVLMRTTWSVVAFIHLVGTSGVFWCKTL